LVYGLENLKLQIIVHAKGVGKGFSLNYPGVNIEKVNRVENQNYAILDLSIAPDAPPGKMSIMVSGAHPVTKIVYELRRKSSEDGKSRIRGVSSADFIYLIMPDRFANGDPSNDAYPDMRNPVATDPIHLRDMGRLKGIEDHLDYFSNLGVTTIWLRPLLKTICRLLMKWGQAKHLSRLCIHQSIPG
jgi:hypothetical protein